MLNNVLFVLVLSGFFSSAFASLTMEDVKKNFPNTDVTSVTQHSDFPGLYEMIVGKKKIIYLNESMDKIIIGHIFDLKTNLDETKERLSNLITIDFEGLPLNNSLKVVKGDGSRVFAVFSDPNCPFCKSLEGALEGVSDYTMYLFMMPIAQLHPSSVADAVNIWCSKNPSSSWHNYLLNSAPLKKSTCSNPVQANMELGESLGINGTPTLIGVDGKLNSGYLPVKKLNAWLSKHGYKDKK